MGCLCMRLPLIAARGGRFPPSQWTSYCEGYQMFNHNAISFRKNDYGYRHQKTSGQVDIKQLSVVLRKSITDKKMLRAPPTRAMLPLPGEPGEINLHGLLRTFQKKCSQLLPWGPHDEIVSRLLYAPLQNLPREQVVRALSMEHPLSIYQQLLRAKELRPHLHRFVGQGTSLGTSSEPLATSARPYSHKCLQA